MNLVVSPEAPAIAHAAAAALLVLHIGGGVVGIASGFAAMFTRKGSKLHRRAGNTFFVSMLVMASIGAGVAPFLDEDQVVNTTAALFTLYLVATGWATAMRRPGRVGRFEPIALLYALALAANGLAVAAIDAATGSNEDHAVVFVFAIIAALAAFSDFRLIRRGGITGAPRIARHVWRMSLALFVATGSLFLGQPQVFPEALRGGPILLIPAVAPLFLMVVWLIRVRFTKAFKPAPAPA